MADASPRLDADAPTSPPVIRAVRFWKPFGVLCQFTDVKGRSTLADFGIDAGLYAAGRLDFDSEGLVILTDDGNLNARLTQPRFRHPRTYWVQVEGDPDEEALSRLAAGVTLNDGPTRPARVVRLDPPDLPDRIPPIRVRVGVPTPWVTMTLTEGRNRQVRRMTAAVGYPTLRLVRHAIGKLTLAGLEPGKWEPLSADQIHRLVGGR